MVSYNEYDLVWSDLVGWSFLTTVSCLFKTHCVNNLFWGLGVGCVIMKEMQCSEAESTANHPAFSAPGLTRHRARYVSRYAACCVVALAFLLSNPRWLSNICFQIGFRLQIFAFKSAASPQSPSHVSTGLGWGTARLNEAPIASSLRARTPEIPGVRQQ